MCVKYEKFVWNILEVEITSYQSRNGSLCSEKQTLVCTRWEKSGFKDISVYCGSVYSGFDVIIYSLTQPIQLLQANEDGIVMRTDPSTVNNKI